MPRQKTSARQPRLLAGKTIGIVGLGQIGGSIIKCLAQYRPAISLLGTDEDDSLARRTRRWCTCCPNLAELVCRSDLVVLAVPVQSIIRLLPSVARHCRRRTSGSRLLVMDTGTVKGAVMKAARSSREDFDFVGLHPLAGTERSGWDAADPDLFVGRRVVYCPGSAARSSAIAREFISLLGGTLLRMMPAEHDRLAAFAIGLPHVLAYAAAGLDARFSQDNPLRGGSWESLTRVARSDPGMVAGFLTANAENQRRALRVLRSHLDRLEQAMGSDSSGELERLLRRWTRRRSESG